MRSRTLPVVVDSQLVPSPRLPPRTTRSATSPPSASPSSSLTRGISPNTSYTRETTVGAAEYDGTNRTLLSPNMSVQLEFVIVISEQQQNSSTDHHKMMQASGVTCLSPVTFIFYRQFLLLIQSNMISITGTLWQNLTQFKPRQSPIVCRET